MVLCEKPGFPWGIPPVSFLYLGAACPESRLHNCLGVFAHLGEFRLQFGEPSYFTRHLLGHDGPLTITEGCYFRAAFTDPKGRLIEFLQDTLLALGCTPGLSLQNQNRRDWNWGTVNRSITPVVVR